MGTSIERESEFVVDGVGGKDRSTAQWVVSLCGDENALKLHTGVGYATL